MKIVGLLQVYNEVRHGNLRRCLDNLSRYCDEIAVYDDGSDDDSVSVARTYTPHVIEGGANDFAWETRHRQQALDLALTLSPDYICWLDADEVFDRGATDGGIRRLCETGLSWEFREISIWRSATWRRLDIWEGETHERLWKVKPGMRIPEKHGLHNRLVPDGLDVRLCDDYRVIHYGFASREAIERRWRARTKLGVPVAVRRRSVDERGMLTERVPPETFPPGIEYVENEPQPTPIRYSEDIMAEAGMVAYADKERYVHADWTVERRRGHVYRLLFDDHAPSLRGRRLLFLGCNTGSTAQLLGEYGCDVTGVDINPRATRVAGERGLRVVTADVTKGLPFEDASFDAVFGLDFFEHVYEWDMPGLVSEVTRVLAPGGILWAFSPTGDSKLANDPEHVQAFHTADDFARPWSGLRVVGCKREDRSHPDPSLGAQVSWFLRAEKAA